MAGKRQVNLWNSKVWVTVRATKEGDQYRIEPDEGQPFVVRASSEETLDDEITKQLRRQFPDK